jgi:hypothetical protein
MTAHEKSNILHDNIRDWEQRLGAYLGMEGCEITDKYARIVLTKLRECRAAQNRLLSESIVIDGVANERIS